MDRAMFWLAAALIWAGPLNAARGQQADAPPPGPLRDTARWELESLLLADGTRLQGLLQRADEKEFEFAEVIRSPGRPMSAVVRVVARADVQQYEPLPDEQRLLLQKRFDKFKNRAAIEAGRMENVALARRDDRAVPSLVYHGPWFRLESTADEESTRRCIVRIEQIFRAYRQLLAPRVEQPRRLEVVLCGSLDEYRGRLRQWGLQLENPALYSPARNMIVAGSDLARFSAQLKQIRAEHEQLLASYQRLQDEFRRRLATLSRDMAREGFSPREIEAEMVLRRAAWRVRQERVERAVNEANRRNNALFAEVTGRMFATLNHEAFHAYLENFVYPHRRFHVDRWLNEGLAQIFEQAQLDADTLRVDAPHPAALAQLQAELAAARALPLADLLTSSDEAFFASHADNTADRRYLYAWGLAYFLAFERDLLGSSQLQRYVSPADPPLPPIARFEQLVGMELAEFERLWQAAMQQLPPPK